MKGPKLFKLGRATGVTLYMQGIQKGKKKQIMDKTLNDGHEEEKKGKKGGMDRTLNDGQEEEKKGKKGEE